MRDRVSRPQKFRVRLTTAFVLVTAISTGALAIFTYALAHNARERNFRQSTNDEARVALALAPRNLDDNTFQRFLRAYESRAGTGTIAVAAGRTYSSNENVSAEQLPPDLLDARTGGLMSEEIEVNGGSYLAYGGTGPNNARYVVVFPLDQLHAGLAEVRNALVLSWLVIVAGSIAVGSLISRRTLRPVREAADAATAMAAGHLDTRLAASGNDEFSVLAHSFNQMADTLQARIDQLGEAAERERQFTSDAAHDLRTPLTGLSATAAMLDQRRDELPPELQRVVAIHVRDVERLRDLVLELLELARLDAHAETLNIETLELRSAVAAVIEALHLPSDATIQLEVHNGLLVQAERTRFRRIMGNLITNAVAHGGQPIEIRARRLTGMVAIDVHDWGPGIPPEMLDHVFDRFSKSDDTRHTGGSGLGLAIAREHALVQHGDITVTSSGSDGTCFTVTLPAASAMAKPAGDRDPEAVGATANDDPSVATALAPELPSAT